MGSWEKIVISFTINLRGSYRISVCFNDGLVLTSARFSGHYWYSDDLIRMVSGSDSGRDENGRVNGRELTRL